MKTNRGVIIFILYLSFISSINAQDYLWFRAGGHYSRVTGHDANIYTPIQGYHLGVGYEKIFSDPVGLKLEMNFNSKGFQSYKEKIDALADRTWYKEFNQLSLDFPIIAMIHFNRFFIEGGFSFNFTLKGEQFSKEETIYKYSSGFDVVESRDMDNYSNPEMAYLAGVGVELFRGIHLSARYTQALTPIGIDYSWKRMSYIQASLSMRLGKKFKPKPISLKTRNQEMLARDYNVTTEQNVSRIEFKNHGDGNQVRFNWPDVEGWKLEMSNLIVESSSGFVNSTGSRILITDAQFPVTCNLRYTMRNSLSGVSFESTIVFVINTPGSWNVTIQH